MISASATTSLGLSLLVGAALLVPAQSPDQIRALCKGPSLQQRLIAQAAEGLQRDALIVEIEGRCAQIELPVMRH